MNRHYSLSRYALTRHPRLSATDGNNQIHGGWVILGILFNLPSTTLLFYGKIDLAAEWFFSTLGIVLLISLLRRDVWSFSVLAMGSLPIMLLLREFLFYNSVLVLMALSIFFFLFADRKNLARLIQLPVVPVLSFLVLVYWLASAINTGNYYANLRSIEMLFSAISLFFLAQNTYAVRAMFLNLMISGILVAIGFLPYGGERLGLTVIDNVLLGNPITVGLPLALVLLLILTAGGQWLALEKHKFLTSCFLIATAVLLILSTSRGSWLC